MKQIKSIKILTDSGCDIDLLNTFALDVEVLPAIFMLNDNAATQDIDFHQEDVFNWQQENIHITSCQLPSAVYLHRFEEALRGQIDHVIVIATGSHIASFYSSANHAKKAFNAKHPEAEMSIDIIDSTTCSLPLSQMVNTTYQAIQSEASIEEVLAALNEVVGRTEMYLGFLGAEGVLHDNIGSFLFSLATDISKVAPIMRLSGDKLKILDAQWGDEDALDRLTDMLRITLGVKKAPYDILYGDRKEQANALAEKLTEKVGYPPRQVVQYGAVMVSRFGYECIAVAFQGEARISE